MSSKMITKHHTYNQGYIALVDLELGDIPDTIEVEGDTLYKKREFHFSITCAKRIAPIIDLENAEKVEAEIVEHFVKFTKEVPLTDFKLLPEFRVVQRDERKTVVVMAELVGMNEWFDRLREMYGKDIPTQPGHITLYTLQQERGIGLLSQAEVETDSHAIQIPELKKLVS